MFAPNSTVAGGRGTQNCCLLVPIMLLIGKKPHNFSSAPIPSSHRKGVSVPPGRVLPRSTPVLDRADKHLDLGDVSPT